MTDAITLEPEEVIERLGGNARTAELCDITPGAVSQWLRNGIPKTQLKFIKLARPDVFKKRNSARRKVSADSG
jgi:predicted transcriptional regulator